MNQILNITRFKEFDDFTLGKLSLIQEDKEIFTCYTLEPKLEGNEANKNLRIKADEYELSWHDSPRFKERLPHIFNNSVAKHRYILIHAGNYVKDTKGCILVGDRYDEMGIYNSKATLRQLICLLKAKTCIIKNEL